MRGDIEKGFNLLGVKRFRNYYFDGIDLQQVQPGQLFLGYFVRGYYFDEQYRVVGGIEEHDVGPHQQLPLAALVIEFVFPASLHPLNLPDFVEVDIPLGFYGNSPHDLGFSQPGHLASVVWGVGRVHIRHLHLLDTQQDFLGLGMAVALVGVSAGLLRLFVRGQMRKMRVVVLPFAGHYLAAAPDAAVAFEFALRIQNVDFLVIGSKGEVAFNGHRRER